MDSLDAKNKWITYEINNKNKVSENKAFIDKYEDIKKKIPKQKYKEHEEKLEICTLEILKIQDNISELQKRFQDSVQKFQLYCKEIKV